MMTCLLILKEMNITMRSLTTPQPVHRGRRIDFLIPLLLLCLILAGCSSSRSAEESTSLAADSEKPYLEIVDRFNNNRQLIEERFVDGEDQLVNNEDGYALQQNEYDSSWNLIRTSYFDASKKAVLVERLGYSYVEMAYDEAGNKIDEKYYDPAGNALALAGKDYASIKYTYDKAVCNYDGDKFTLEIDKWNDYDGEQLQVISNGKTYLISANKCYLIKD